MICEKCGAEFEEGIFCPECGTRYRNNIEENINDQRRQAINNYYNEERVLHNTDSLQKHSQRRRKQKNQYFKKIRFWMSIILLILLIIAGILFVKQLDKSEESLKDKTREKAEAPISLEEAGGFAAWKEDGFSKVVRTDLVMKLPVEEENDTKCTAVIKAAEENVIAIMQKDGAEVKDWNWMDNGAAQEIAADEASFKATLAYTGEETEEKYPIFFVSDIENYSLSDKEKADNNTEDEKQEESEAKNEYIFPDSDKKYLSEDEIRSVDVDKLAFGRNEIFARHGYIFKNETYQEYFEGTSWYKGTVTASEFDEDAVFNDQEKKNVELIKSIEDEVNGTSKNNFIGLSGVYICTTPQWDDFIGKIEFGQPQNGTMSFSMGLLDYPYSLLNGTATILDANTVQIKEDGIIITLSWSNSENMYVTHEGELNSRDAGSVDVITDNMSYNRSTEFN